LGGVNPRLHHGTLNAMFLPAVVRFNASAESVQKERRMQRMAYAMGLGEIDQAHEAAEAIALAITAMNTRLGLPQGLAEMGVETAWFDKIIEGAMADHCHKTNPRIATEQEYREMLQAAM
jgi:alcohol dehydrogenase class IV